MMMTKVPTYDKKLDVLHLPAAYVAQSSPSDVAATCKTKTVRMIPVIVRIIEAGRDAAEVSQMRFSEVSAWIVESKYESQWAGETTSFEHSIVLGEDRPRAKGVSKFGDATETTDRRVKPVKTGLILEAIGDGKFAVVRVNAEFGTVKSWERIINAQVIDNRHD